MIDYSTLGIWEIQGFPVSVLLMLGLHIYAHSDLLCFLHGLWNPNSRIHVCKTNSLPTEPLSQILYIFFLVNIPETNSPAIISTALPLFSVLKVVCRKELECAEALFGLRVCKALECEF